MNRERSEKGVVLVLVAVSMIVILGLAALVIDLGYLWLTKNQLHVAADAAALAGAANLSGTADDCTNTTARTAAQTFAAFHKAGSQTGQASLTLAANTGNAADGDIVVGNFTRDREPGDPTKNFIRCGETDGTPVNAVKVRARRTDASTTSSQTGDNPPAAFFGGIFGTPISNVGAFATAIGGIKGDAPICIASCFVKPGCPTTGIVLQPDNEESAAWSNFKGPQNNVTPQQIADLINGATDAPCIDFQEEIELFNGIGGGGVCNGNLYQCLDAVVNDDPSANAPGGGDDAGHAVPWPVAIPVCEVPDTSCADRDGDGLACEAAQGEHYGNPNYEPPVVNVALFNIQSVTPTGPNKGIVADFVGLNPASGQGHCTYLVE
jgi:Flp pilus assembly protein TadG